jgi:hypothetical protein
MAIVIEAFTVIVRNSTLDAKYPGGKEAFASECPNRTYCCDEALSRVSFMHPYDADSFVVNLAKKGLTFVANSRAVDVAIISQFHGLSHECDWLVLGMYKGVPVAWLAGTTSKTIVGPPGWTLDRHIEHISAEEAKERLIYLRTENSIDVYKDNVTGKEVYVGRVGRS